jgi:hypothetical protein
MSKQITLGNTVKDKVTSFTGIAVARIEYINGCVQFCVKPKTSKDGKMPEGEYLDVQQLDFVDNGISLDAEPTGGDQIDCPK